LTCQELAREMAAGSERSVLLMIASLSLFCIFRVCAGQLNLVLTRREGPERNDITLACFDGESFEVLNAVFYMRAPGAVTRTIVDETVSGLRNFRRDNNGAEIAFTITPETEALFSCASPTAEAPDLLVAGTCEFFIWRILCVDIKFLYCFILSTQHSGHCKTTVFVIDVGLHFLGKLLNWSVIFSLAEQESCTATT